MRRPPLRTQKYIIRPHGAACATFNLTVQPAHTLRAAHANCSQLGRAPLHIACMKGHVEVVRVLLKHHANPNAATKVSARAAHPAVVRLCCACHVLGPSALQNSPHASAWRYIPAYLPVESRAMQIACS